MAIHFDGLIRKGAVRDYADLARLGHVARARVTQIMNLLNQAPDIPR
jgi:regulator of RNase E activity RraA